MNDNIEVIRIIIFRIGDIRIGMDMEFISEIRRTDQIGRQELDDIFRLDEKLPFSTSYDYESPIVLCLAYQNKTIGMIVDHLEDVNMPIFIKDIRILPSLIEACMPFSPIWAAVMKDEEIILLVDPLKLILMQSDPISEKYL